MAYTVQWMKGALEQFSDLSPDTPCYSFSSLWDRDLLGQLPGSKREHSSHVDDVKNALSYERWGVDTYHSKTSLRETY